MSSNEATSVCHPERRPSLCYHEQRRFFVILNELFLTVILNGVKDLGHDNVQEMCPPDSSLTLRMTEGALRMTERTLRMTCKGCYAGEPSALTNCRNGGRTFPSLRGALLPQGNNDVMQGQPSALTNCRNGGRTFPSLRGIFSLFFPPLRQLLLSLRSQQKISTHGTLTTHSRIPSGRTICRQG